MFCVNCGAEMAENMRFCPACGSSVNQNAVAPSGEQRTFTKQQPEVRQNSLQIMDQVASLIPLIEADWNQSVQLNNDYDRLNGARVKKGLIIPFMIIGALISEFGILLLLGKNGFALGVVILLIGLPFLIVGISSIISESKRVKRCRAQAAELLPQREACLNRIYNVYAENRLEDYYPFRYFIPDCITEIRNNVQNFRADTIKEAINVYEQSQFYEQMKQHNAEMMHLLEYTAQQARAVAVYSAANFYFK